VVAELKPGVLGRIRSCEAGSDWCQVQIGDYRGFLKRSDFWGTQPGEVIAN
jgi:SH3-like domain-containing protein